MAALYDTIGKTYSQHRQPDPRIAARINAALGTAKTVLNVGAGTGSYEPEDRTVTAVEPSAEMIRQRPATAAPVIQANAESLPFADNSFDAAMAILTIHHWTDQAQGLRELRRVSQGRVVILTFDPDFRNFWLADYLPEIDEIDQRQMPGLSDFESQLGPVKSIPVPIPHDCIDGILCAYWRRPSAYLDPQVRAGSSTFSKLGDISGPLERLEQDIASGEWERRYADLLAKEECDFGYHLV
ncbi:MAG: class I SAM-dependent methyltransferase, partial [Rhodobacteraceae bacterium]|nr:class I SAM-dependent methyltransferase [Paracoccaceae bacterium]